MYEAPLQFPLGFRLAKEGVVGKNIEFWCPENDGYTLLVKGKTGSGKTHLVKNLINEFSTIMGEELDSNYKIIYMSNVYSSNMFSGNNHVQAMSSKNHFLDRLCDIVGEYQEFGGSTSLVKMVVLDELYNVIVKDGDWTSTDDNAINLIKTFIEVCSKAGIYFIITTQMENVDGLFTSSDLGCSITVGPSSDHNYIDKSSGTPQNYTGDIGVATIWRSPLSRSTFKIFQN